MTSPEPLPPSSPPPPQIAVQYAAAEQADAPPRRAVRAWVKAALAAAACSGEVAVRFVGEAESAALNGKYRGKAAATNVLAFDYCGNIGGSDAGGGGAVLGDVLVCAPLVRQEAQQSGITAQAHYAHLVVHGVLHLAGHRHDTPAAAAAMESLEARVLHQLGIGNPHL